MIHPRPVVLERGSVRLEPMSVEHVPGLQEAARDGALWELWYTVVPSPDETAGLRGHRFAGPRGRPHASLGGA